MRKVLLVAVIAVVVAPVMGLAQTEAPLSGVVPVTQLPSSYQYWSDHQTNREFDIVQPSGSASNAVNTVFSRSGADYKIAKVEAKTQVYDPIKSSTFERVVYAAAKKEKHTTTTYKYDGEEIYVTVDYRPAKPPKQRQREFAEAYIAQVEQGKVGTQTVKVTVPKQQPKYGWKFNKVGAN